MRRLFEGGVYLRAVSISGNTVLALALGEGMNVAKSSFSDPITKAEKYLIKWCSTRTAGCSFLPSSGVMRGTTPLASSTCTILVSAVLKSIPRPTLRW